MGSSALAIGGAALGYSGFAEAKNLHLEHIFVTVPKSKLRSPVKILHMSDLHYSSFVSVKFLEKAFDLGLSQSPDVICLTGDFVTAGDSCRIKDIKHLLSDVGKSKPTFASLGNHDGGVWSAARGGLANSSEVVETLESAGIQLLSNRSVTQFVGSNEIQFTGLEDLWSGNPDVSTAFSNTLDSLPRIVLSHNPDSKSLFKDRNWDICLSGHTHGGQIVLPFIGPPFVPIRDKAYTSGLNIWLDKKVYTSRGVGNLLGLRFNCPPEVAIVELRPDV